MFKKIIIVGILIVTASSLTAETKKKTNFWSKVNTLGQKVVNPKKTSIHTLIVTSNRRKGILLADLIQSYTGQPYLSLPVIEEGGEIMFNPQSNGASNPQNDNPSFGIHYSNLKQFIHFLRPKRVVFLGDESYVSNEYRQLLKVKDTWSISGNAQEWGNIAERAGAFFSISSLKEEFVARFNEIYKRENKASLLAPIQEVPRPSQGDPIQNEQMPTTNPEELLIQDPK